MENNCVVPSWVAINEQRDTFTGVNQLYETAKLLLEIDCHDVCSWDEEFDEREYVSWRDLLWTHGRRMSGEDSVSDDRDNLIQTNRVGLALSDG